MQLEVFIIYKRLKIKKNEYKIIRIIRDLNLRIV